VTPFIADSPNHKLSHTVSTQIITMLNRDRYGVWGIGAGYGAICNNPFLPVTCTTVCGVAVSISCPEHTVSILPLFYLHCNSIISASYGAIFSNPYFPVTGTTCPLCVPGWIIALSTGRPECTVSVLPLLCLDCDSIIGASYRAISSNPFLPVTGTTVCRVAITVSCPLLTVRVFPLLDLSKNSVGTITSTFAGNLRPITLPG